MRELRFKVEQPGFRVNELVLVTTMLDATEYTKEELADLFLQRFAQDAHRVVLAQPRVIPGLYVNGPAPPR